MRRCLPAVLLVLALSASACSAEAAATRDEAGAVSSEGAVDVFEIAVGDCFDEPAAPSGDPDETLEIESISAVPCAQEHDGEVFHDFDLPEGEYPGDEAVVEESDVGCGEQFAGFVGVAYEDSVLDFYPIHPTGDSWELGGDRKVSCVVFEPGARVTGSLAGAAR